MSLTPFFDETDPARWNEFANHAPHAHLMQAYEWGAFKAETGWRVQRVGLRDGQQIVAGAQLFFRKLPLLPLTLAYIPKGPLVDTTNEPLADALWQVIHTAARQQRAIFLMLEANFPDDEATLTHLTRHGFRRSDHTNHPHSTIIVDLTPDETTMLKTMRKKTRQLIRKAAREGIEIVEGTQESLPELYQVLQTTADIKDIASHEQEFYQTAWQIYQPNNQVKLFFAKYQEQIVAAKMIFTFGERSLHFWGGTTHEGRQRNASYLIQWEALRWAKRHGFQQADLWGIPDEVGQLLKQGQDVPKDERSDLWGVYLFKRGFGGEIESYIGTFDYVYKPFWYRLAKLFANISIDSLSQWAERLRSGER